MSPPPAILPVQACPGATQVLKAARELFAEHGVDAVSMQDVATRAGVSKANIFHHYASKEALYLAVMRACVQNKTVDVEALIASPAPFTERLLALLSGQIDDMLCDASATRLVMREVSNAHDERARLIATEIFAGKVRDRVRFFEDAQARGELRDGVQPDVCDMLLISTCKFYFNCQGFLPHMTGQAGASALACPQTFARAICEVLTQGMCAPRRKAAAKPRAKRVKPKTAVAHRNLPRAASSPKPRRKART